MRILLTGRNGQVGWELERALPALGELIATDRGTLDLANADAIRRAVREAKPDLIVNAAAYTAVDRAETERDAAIQVNAVAPGVLAEEAKRAGALLIHFSTDYVYDGAKPAPYVEADAVNPLSVYGATKLEGERAIAAAGARHIILRTSWVYGPRGKNFMLTMLRFGRERPELRVVDDQRGAPTSSRALARLVRELLDRNADLDHVGRDELDRLAAASGTYHATAGGVTTWFGFAQAIFEEARRQRRLDYAPPRVTPIPTKDYPTPARRPANSVLSNDKLRAAFGVSIPDWRAGLEEAISALPG